MGYKPTLYPGTYLPHPVGEYMYGTGTGTGSTGTNTDLIDQLARDAAKRNAVRGRKGQYEDYKGYLQDYADENGWTDHIPIVGFTDEIVDDIISQREREGLIDRLNQEQKRRNAIDFANMRDAISSLSNLPQDRLVYATRGLQTRAMRRGGLVMRNYLEGFNSGGKLIKKKW